MMRTDAKPARWKHVPKIDGELLTYDEVRSIFRWNDNRTIRDYLKKGMLVRVRLSNSTKSYRITGDSVRSLLTHIKSIVEQENYLVRARMQTARERKGLETVSNEVLLDPDELTRRFNEGRRTPAVREPEPQQAEPPRVRPMTTFSNVRGI